jgi:CHASE2 domain-containing sensor protein
LSKLKSLIPVLQTLRAGVAGKLALAWLALCGLIGAAGWLGLLERIELLAYDAAIAYSSQARSELPVVLVGSSDEDLQKYGWPLPDDKLAAVIEHVAAAGAVAIGVDLYRDRPVGGDEEVLAELLRKRRNVVFVSKLSSGRQAAIEGPKSIRGSSQIGFADIPIDDDGVTRRALLFAEDASRTQISFGLRLALAAMEAKGIKPERVGDTVRIRLGARTIRPITGGEGPYHNVDNGGYQLLIDYRDEVGGFRRFSVADVIEGRAGAQNFKGRVVIVGTAAQGVKDFFSVPSNRIVGDRQAFGIEVHAQIVTQLLRLADGEGRQILSVPAPLGQAWVLALVALALALGWRLQRLPLLLLAGAGGLVALAAIHFALFQAGWWLALTPGNAGLGRRPWLGHRLCHAFAVAAAQADDGPVQPLLLAGRCGTDLEPARRSARQRRHARAPADGCHGVLLRPGRFHLQGRGVVAEGTHRPAQRLLRGGGFDHPSQRRLDRQVHRRRGDGGVRRADSAPEQGGNLYRCASRGGFGDRIRRRHRQAQRRLCRCRLADDCGAHGYPHRAGGGGQHRQHPAHGVHSDRRHGQRRRAPGGPRQGWPGDRSSRILISETTRHCLDASFSVERLGEFRLHGKREMVEVHHVLGRATDSREVAK